MDTIVETMLRESAGKIQQAAEQSAAKRILALVHDLLDPVAGHTAVVRKLKPVPRAAPNGHKKPTPALNQKARILAQLGATPKTTQQIAKQARAPLQSVYSVLSEAIAKKRARRPKPGVYVVASR